GKGADMAERRQPALKANRAVPAAPGVGRLRAAFPAPGAFLVLAAGKDRIGRPPGRLVEPRRPDRLFFRPHQGHLAEALQLAAVAAVHQPVIG
ncbi:hypothetical protein DF186_15445, partial [Enterococcus hirae]